MLSFFRKIGPGLLLCLILAVPAWLLGQAFPVIGGPVFAILLGILVGMVLNRKVGPCPSLQPGITFTSKKILQYAVVLLGFGLNLSQIAQVGATSLPIIASTIATSLIIAFVLYRLLKIPKNSATLVGVGSSICGGSAIAATAPVIGAEEEEIAQSISVIFLFNVLAALLFPTLGGMMGLTNEGFGLFAGTAINDTSSVTAAASTWDSLHATGGSVLAYAPIVKLTRTLAIIPITLCLAFFRTWQAKKGGSDTTGTFSLRRVFPFFILFFYCALGGYCIKYTVLNIGDLFGAGFGSNGLSGGEIFGNFLGSPAEGIIYGLIFVALTMLIVMGGVGGGIEKVCSVGMPALFVALLICIIRACTLEGTDVAVQILQADGSLVEGVVNGSALDGLKYMFSPGWAANVGYYVPAKAVVDGAEVSSIMVNGVAQAIVAYKSGAPSIFNVVSTAGGQMFFSLSLGMGAMITYGSYLHKKENLQKNALLIIIMDTMVALMAGLCVMPARFALDPAGNIGGPKLLFITMQNVFHSMGTLGPIFGILFYLLVVFAAISSSISLLEAVVAHFVDKARDSGKGDKRKKYTLIAAAAVGVGAILICADSLGGADFTPWKFLGLPEADIRTWNDCWLDFFDMLSEGIMMPLGALLMSIMIGWELGPDVVKEECEQSGHPMSGYGFFKVCIKFITPLCMILVLYGQIKEFFF